MTETTTDEEIDEVKRVVRAQSAELARLAIRAAKHISQRTEADIDRCIKQLVEDTRDATD